LTRSSRHLGLYDYSAQDRQQLLELVQVGINPADRVLVEDVLKDFSSLNRTIVKEAIDAITVLTKGHGFTPEMAMFFLNDVPLLLWQKEVSRLEKRQK